MSTPALNPIGHNKPPSEVEIVREQLNEKHGQLLMKANVLVDGAAGLPQVVTSDEEAGQVSDYIKMLTGAMKDLEGARVAEKEPHLRMGRAVDGFFKHVSDGVETVKRKINKPLDTFLREKEAAVRRRREEEATEARRVASVRAAEAQRLEEANKPLSAAVALDKAVISEATAVRAEQATVVKPAEIGKARGRDGALASLRTRWFGEIIDRETLDLEKLRPFIAGDVLQMALNLYVKAGHRDLRGAKIYEFSETVVR